MGFKNFNFDNLELRDSTLVRKTFAFFGLQPPRSVAFKEKGFKFWKYPTLQYLGIAAGFTDTKIVNALLFHHNQFVLSRIVLLLFAYLLYVPFVVFILQIRPLVHRLTLFQGTLFFLLFLLATYVTITISFRLYAVFASKYFADSMCVAAIIYLLYDLYPDDALINPDKKKDLMLRMDYIASKTLMLASRYSSRDEKNRDWANRHFKEMELYVRERERWIIAPTASTLENLRTDVYELTKIYILGDYGNFVWRNLYVAPETLTLNWFQRLIKGLPRFFGIILPLILMGVYLWQPLLFPSIQIDTNVVTILFMAWLLLAIDAALDLGIVAGLANLAKGIRDLA